MRKKEIMKKKEEAPAKISQKEGYVEIEFSKDISPEAIKKQVEECVGETCTCCSPSFREKVENFEHSETDANNVKIYGSITKEEVINNVSSCAPKIS